MAGIIKQTCMLLIALVLAVAVAPRSQAVVTCETVVSSVKPCIPYVLNDGPIGGCCAAVKSLYAAAATADDRKTVCGCLKDLVAKYSSANLSKAAEIPAKCGVSFPYKISPSTDCSNVK